MSNTLTSAKDFKIGDRFMDFENDVAVVVGINLADNSLKAKCITESLTAEVGMEYVVYAWHARLLLTDRLRRHLCSKSKT
jgi:hypothetical protein